MDIITQTKFTEEQKKNLYKEMNDIRKEVRLEIAKNIHAYCLYKTALLEQKSKGGFMSVFKKGFLEKEVEQNDTRETTPPPSDVMAYENFNFTSPERLKITSLLGNIIQQIDRTGNEKRKIENTLSKAQDKVRKLTKDQQKAETHLKEKEVASKNALSNFVDVPRMHFIQKRKFAKQHSLKWDEKWTAHKETMKKRKHWRKQNKM